VDNSHLEPQQRKRPLRAQAHALLDNPEQLKRFPPEELYGLINSLGLEDALELVQCMAPGQFSALMDFVAWRGDRFQLNPLMVWLRAALGEDEEAFWAKIQALGAEFIELIFLRSLNIKQAESDEEDPSLEFMETLDGHLRLEFLVTGDAQHVMRRMIEIWMGRSALGFRRFLEAVRWSLPSELEEGAYFFRNARLADLGFPSRERAASLFARVDIKKYLLAPQTPSLVEVSENFFEEGFKALSGEQRIQLEAEARYLVNGFLVAEETELWDAETIYDLSCQARDYLNLGLHYITSGQACWIDKACRQFGLQKIFQVGLSLTLDLKYSLNGIGKAPHAQHLAQWQGLWWTLEALYPSLSALGLKRPLLWKEGKRVMFKTLADIALAQAQLEKAKRQMAIMAALHHNEPQKALLPFGVELKLLRPERFFCSALAHFVVEGKVLPKPFPTENLKSLEAKLYASAFAALSTEFAQAMLLKEPLFEEAREMALSCLELLHAELDAANSPQELFGLPLEGLPLCPLGKNEAAST